MINRIAFEIVSLMWIICGLMLLTLIFTVKKDQLKVQITVREAMLKSQTALFSPVLNEEEVVTYQGVIVRNNQNNQRIHNNKKLTL